MTGSTVRNVVATPSSGTTLRLAAQACSACGGPPAFEPGRDPLWKDTLYGMFNRFSYIKVQNQAREFERARLNTTPAVSCTMCGRSEELPPMGEAPVPRHRLPTDGAARTAGAATPAPAAPSSGPATCVGCGAVAPVSGTVVSTVCESCGNTLLNDEAIAGGADRPGIDGVLPLAIDEITAHRRLMQRCNALRVPISQRKHYRDATMRLTYYPYVVFSPDHRAGVEDPTGAANDSSVPTGWADVAGHVPGTAEADSISVAVPAARGLEGVLPTKRGPVPPLYGAANAVAFRPEYLAGATSIGPDADIGSYRSQGETMVAAALAEAAREYGGETGTKAEALSYRVVLAPAYCGTVVIDRERHRFWVDGTTGIATAETPGSWWGIPFLLVALPLILGGLFAAVIAAAMLGLLAGWAIGEPFWH